MIKNIPLFKVHMPQSVNEPLLKTLHSGYLSEGERVKEFKEIMSVYLDNEYVIPVSNCTMALTISYRVSGVKQGDEVISTPLTCIATNTPLINIGAKIVWSDVNPKTGMIDASKLESIITPKTKAIVVLHKDGDLAEMDKIKEIATKYGLKIIEDAAHALGGSYKGIKVGNIGDFTCFSLQAIKQITTADGGLLVCNNEEDYKLAKKYKWLGVDKENSVGNPWFNDIEISGYKANMNDLTATIGIEQMKYVNDVIDIYHRNGELYSELLKGVEGVDLIDREKDSYSTYWTYVILTDKREKIIESLKNEGISASVVHPRNDNYSIFKDFKRELPGVEEFSKRELSLPCGFWVSKEDINKIVKIIKDCI